VDNFWSRISVTTVLPPHWLVCDELVTKEYYSLMLKKDARTLRRWESEIIRKCKVTAWRYYELPLPINCIPMLDGYRRLILLLIADRREKGDSYKDILSELRSQSPEINRKQFKQWRANYYDEWKGS
jgi:hypothetical protein